MFGTSTYLIYVLVFSVIPIAVYWLVSFRFLGRNWRVIGMTALVIFVYMCVTDPLAEAWHNWYFSNDRLLGWWMINFPVEEGLFFLLVPIAVASATLCFIDYREKLGQAQT
jgi:lycopene cyclase domain-containing protein